MLRIIAGALVAALALAAYAQPVATWDFLGEAWKPARLSDCPPDTKITINTSAGIAHQWRRFCYWGRT